MAASAADAITAAGQLLVTVLTELALSPDEASATDTDELLASFATVVSERQAAVAAAYTAASAVSRAGHAEERAVKGAYAAAMKRLETLADDAGVILPYQIRYHVWWQLVGGAADASDTAALSQSLGARPRGPVHRVWQSVYDLPPSPPPLTQAQLRCGVA